MVDVKVDTGKAKRGENLEDLLALLDEDDLYELRQRAKQRLIERIEDGGASDVASFEQPPQRAGTQTALVLYDRVIHADSKPSYNHISR
ncbi:MAG: hypothetical protein HND48_17525 [Chloroflexi bacterium]|nr:hypothetical protein [Chloroflexota bacterium]